MDPYSDPAMMHPLYYPQPMMASAGYHQAASANHYSPYPGSLDATYRPHLHGGGLPGMMPGTSPMGYMPPNPYDGMYGSAPAGYMPSQSPYTPSASAPGIGPPMMGPSTGSSMMYSGIPDQNTTTVQSGMTEVQAPKSHMAQFNLNPTTPTSMNMPRPPPLKRGIVRGNQTPPKSPAQASNSPSANTTPPAIRMPSPPNLMKSPQKSLKDGQSTPPIPEKGNKEGSLSKDGDLNVIDPNHTKGGNTGSSSQEPDSGPKHIAAISPSGPQESPSGDDEVPSSDCPSTDMHWLSGLGKMGFSPDGFPVFSNIREGEDYRFYKPENKYNCLKCNYTTLRWDKIEQHSIAHRGKLICEECGKAFIKGCDLDRHMSIHITGRMRRNPPFDKARKAKSSSSTLNPQSPRWVDSMTGEVLINGDLPNQSLLGSNNTSPAASGNVPVPKQKSPTSDRSSTVSQASKAKNPIEYSIDLENEGSDLCQVEKVREGRVNSEAATSLESGGPVQSSMSQCGEGSNLNSHVNDISSLILEKEIKKENISDSDLPLFSMTNASLDGRCSSSVEAPTASSDLFSVEESAFSLPPSVAMSAAQAPSSLDSSPEILPGSRPPTKNQVAVPPHVFRDAQGLIPRVDPQGRNFRCTLCSYSTRDSWHLEKHYLAHTRQYKICRYCGKAFERPSDLMRHHERHVKYMLEAQGQKKFAVHANSEVPTSKDPDLTSPRFSRKASPVPPHRRFSNQLPINQPFQGLTAPPPRARKSRTYFYCDMCNFKFISKIALKIHKKQVHNATVIRMDMYRKSVLTFTCLLEMEVTDNNEVTIQPNLVKVDDMLKPDLQIPPVSDITDIRYILDCAKKTGIIPSRTGKPPFATTSHSQEMNRIDLTSSPTISESTSSHVTTAPVTSPNNDLMATPVSSIPTSEMSVESTMKQLSGRDFSVGLPCTTSSLVSDGILTSDMFIHASHHSQTSLSSSVMQNRAGNHTEMAKNGRNDTTTDITGERSAEHVTNNAKEDMIDGTSQGDIHVPKQIQNKYENCIYKCDRCSYGTNMKHKLDQHLHAHRGRYICKVCGKAFIKTSDLVRHWPSHAMSQISGMLKCDSCPFQTYRKTALTNHMKTHYICRGLSGSEEPDSGSNKDDIWPDSQVNAVVPVPKSMLKPGKPGRKRMRRQQPEVDYGFGFTTVLCYCPECGDEFRSARALSNHRYEEHNEDDKDEDVNAPSMYCKYCNKEFNSTTKLLRHESMHMSYGALENRGKSTSRSSVRCEYCLKIFTSKFYLKDHINIHTGVKPYECDFCHEKFAIKATMINHMNKLCGTKSGTRGRKRKRGNRWSQGTRHSRGSRSLSVSESMDTEEDMDTSAVSGDRGETSDAESDTTIPALDNEDMSSVEPTSHPDKEADLESGLSNQ